MSTESNFTLSVCSPAGRSHSLHVLEYEKPVPTVEASLVQTWSGSAVLLLPDEDHSWLDAGNVFDSRSLVLHFILPPWCCAMYSWSLHMDLLI